MRKLPLLLPSLLILLLLSLLTAAASAQALSLPVPGDVPVEIAGEEPEESEDEDEDELEDATPEDLEDAEEGCDGSQEEEEEDDLCGVAEEVEAEECVLEDATARVAALPGAGSVQVTIHYKAFNPASVAIDARLRGSRGRLHLGARHAHFRRAGVFRDTFPLGEKRMERAIAAREFEVELQAVNAPRYCRLELSGAPRRARRSLHADAPGRSGGRGRTRGR